MMTGWAMILGDATFGGTDKASAFCSRWVSTGAAPCCVRAALDASRRATRARNAAFSFSRASSRAEICSSSVAADAGCRTAAAANARQRSKTSFVNLLMVRTPRSHPIGELHARLPRPASSDEITPSRAERRENPKRCSDYWVLTTRDTDNAPRDCGLPVNLSFAGIVTIPAQANHPAKNLAVLSGRVCKILDRLTPMIAHHGAPALCPTCIGS